MSTESGGPRDVNPSHAMFSHSHLASVAGVSPSRLRYWETSNLVRPRVAESGRGSRQVRLYDYQDALTVLILAAMRKEVSLQHIRQIVEHLRQRQFQVPEVQFAITGSRVFFQLPDGEWEDVRDPHQIVLRQTLDLRPLRAKLDHSGERPADAVGMTERRRGARGSRPLIAGTRVPVSAVERYLERGSLDADILAAYPSLTELDIDGVRASASA